MKAKLHSYVYASDLNQWIPFYTREVKLAYTKHRNLKVVGITWPYSSDKDKLYECYHPFNVFNRAGILISHPLSRRKAAIIQSHKLPRLYDITHD